MEPDKEIIERLVRIEDKIDTHLENHKWGANLFLKLGVPALSGFISWVMVHLTKH